MTNIEKNRFETILLWAMRLLIVFTLFTPVIVKFGYMFPFIVPRAFYFQIITSILLIVNIAALAFFPNLRPSWTKINKVLVFYFAVAILTTITSIEPSKSFIGTVERMFGLYGFLHLGIVFLAAITCLRDKKEWIYFLTVTLTISLLPSMNFILMILGILPTYTSSIMGNQTFLAAYGILNFFLAIYLLTQTKKFKFLLGIIILVQFSTIILTGVRGGFIGLVASALFAIVYYAWNHPKWRINFIGIGLILLATYGLIYVNRENSKLRSIPALQKITNFSLDDATIKARFSMWKMALKGAMEKPILGWGRENYSVVFNKHFDSSFNEAKVGESWEDRAHNIIFDELVVGGLIGLISYLLILATAFVSARKEPILISLLIAYTIQNLFGVENLNSSITFFILLALFNFSETGEEKNHNREIAKKPSAYAITAVSTILICISTYFFTFQPIYANSDMLLSGQSFLQNNLKLSEQYFKQGIARIPLFPMLKLELSSLLATFDPAQYGVQIPPNIYFDYLSNITEENEPLIAAFPYEQRWHVNSIQIYFKMALINMDASYLDKADALLIGLNKSTPNRKMFAQLAENSQRVRTMLAQQNIKK